jgi:hypothetical protein
MEKKRKQFRPKDVRTVRYDKKTKLWIPNRKRLFLYWYKFLQHALKDDQRTVNMRKYSGWGSKETILTEKFDSWWTDNWIQLFGYAEGKKPKYSLSNEKQKADPIRYALLVYENRHRGTNWEIGVRMDKQEYRTRNQHVPSVEKSENLDLVLEGKRFKRNLKSDDPRRTITDNESRNWKTNRVVIGGNSDHKEDEDRDLYLAREVRREVQSRVGRFKRNANKILDNVCNGQFP